MGTPHDPRATAGTAEDTPEVRITVRTAEHMRELGRRLAALLGPGDLVLLTGELGAGKTTLTRGLGEGLGVRGAVTSPTFVIARVHPSLTDGPALVHVDAYRLGGGLDEMEDLDLDVSLPESVVVVEWGEGKVEDLSDARLQVVIGRAIGTPAAAGPVGDAYLVDVDGIDGIDGVEDLEDDEAADEAEYADETDATEAAEDVREVTVLGIGPRWSGLDLTPLAR